MASKKRVIRLWFRILKQIGTPPIRLVFKNEWEEIAGYNFGSSLGRAERDDLLVGVRYHGLELKEIKNTLWHEIGHILFPSKPHWWIECYAGKMSAYGDREGVYSKRYGHSIGELPSRNQLLVLSRKAVLKPEFMKLSRKHVDSWRRQVLVWLDQLQISMAEAILFPH